MPGRSPPMTWAFQKSLTGLILACSCVVGVALISACSSTPSSQIEPARSFLSSVAPLG